jgi:hypothetical protein
MPLIALTLAASVDEAWLHLREPELIRRWFGWDYDGLDEEIELIFLQAAVAGEHEIRWADGDRIELARQGERAVMRIHREPQESYDPIAEGWISFAHQLRFALEHHPGEPRATVHLTGGRPRQQLCGTPYFSDANQAGSIVDDALLVVVTELDGSTTMTLNAYGEIPPDAARWRRWWVGGRP